jgi:hypothetical protein
VECPLFDVVGCGMAGKSDPDLVLWHTYGASDTGGDFVSFMVKKDGTLVVSGGTFETNMTQHDSQNEAVAEPTFDVQMTYSAPLDLVTLHHLAAMERSVTGCSELMRLRPKDGAVDKVPDLASKWARQETACNKSCVHDCFDCRKSCKAGSIKCYEKCVLPARTCSAGCP